MSFHLTILRLTTVFGISFTTGYLIGKKIDTAKYFLKVEGKACTFLKKRCSKNVQGEV